MKTKVKIQDDDYKRLLENLAHPIMQKLNLVTKTDYLEFDEKITELFIELISKLKEKGLSNRNISNLIFGYPTNHAIIVGYDRSSIAFHTYGRRASLMSRLKALAIAGYKLELYVHKPEKIFYPKTKLSNSNKPSDPL